MVLTLFSCAYLEYNYPGQEYLFYQKISQGIFTWEF